MTVRHAGLTSTQPKWVSILQSLLLLLLKSKNHLCHIFFHHGAGMFIKISHYLSEYALVGITGPARNPRRDSITHWAGLSNRRQLPDSVYRVAIKPKEARPYPLNHNTDPILGRRRGTKKKRWRMAFKCYLFFFPGARFVPRNTRTSPVQRMRLQLRGKAVRGSACICDKLNNAYKH